MVVLKTIVMEKIRFKRAYQRIEFVGACLRLSLGEAQQLMVSEGKDPEVIWDRLD